MGGQSHEYMTTWLTMSAWPPPEILDEQVTSVTGWLQTSFRECNSPARLQIPSALSGGASVCGTSTWVKHKEGHSLSRWGLWPMAGDAPAHWVQYRMRGQHTGELGGGIQPEDVEQGSLTMQLICWVWGQNQVVGGDFLDSVTLGTGLCGHQPQ
jgi:hypothetical protein